VGSGVTVSVAVAVGSGMAEAVSVTLAAGVVGAGVELGCGVSKERPQALKITTVSSRTTDPKKFIFIQISWPDNFRSDNNITILVRFYNRDFLFPFQVF
jgi:hypothetical protein